MSINEQSLIHLHCRGDITLHRVVHFNTEPATSMTPDEWEVAAENIDIGGCSLENPMDLMSTSYEALQEGEFPDMDIWNDMSTEPGDVSHGGFISEIEESEIELDRNRRDSLLQADRIVERIDIAYARKATQVDVQKLKVWIECDND